MEATLSRIEPALHTFHVLSALHYRFYTGRHTQTIGKQYNGVVFYDLGPCEGEAGARSNDAFGAHKGCVLQNVSTGNRYPYRTFIGFNDF